MLSLRLYFCFSARLLAAAATLFSQDFDHESVLSWPSGHAAASMAGLLFIAYVLWSDLMALVKVGLRALDFVFSFVFFSCDC